MKWLLALALLVASPAYAQIQYGTAYSPDGVTCVSPKNLDGAALDPAAKYCVVHTGCKVPELWLLDRTASTDKTDTLHEWAENRAPCDWQGGEGKLVLFATGSHTLKIDGTTVVAGFTVGTSTPQPPVPTAAPGTITWDLPVTNIDGSTLTDLAGFRIYTGNTLVTTVGPTVTSWKYTASGTYYLIAFTATGAESIPSSSVTVTLAPPVVPVDCKVGDWVSGTPGPWIPAVCATGTWAHDVPQSRAITTQPANGGAACPKLTQTITETEACTVPAPVDVCKADPLTAKVTAWQGGTSGARSLSYTTSADKKIVDIHEIMVPPKVTFTDSRGCSVSVTR